jgi:hypothetical protein
MEISMDVALVALSVAGVENHAICALEGALRSAGLSEAVVPFGGFSGLERSLGEVLALRPRVVGVSLQTIESALATLAFTRILRARGFSGRIVVGGHFATLNAEDLLRADAGIDAVVRFAGERALVAIAQGALDDGARASRTPGLVFKDSNGDVRKGAPPEWTSPSVLARATRFDALPEHLGFAAADMVASRGCEAHCAYCCVAAASDLARRESIESGRAPAAYERRSVEVLAEEMAALYHDYGARVFNFMDDNVLPLDPRSAAEWADELRRRLDAKRVRALARLGLARAYVGIDGYSSSQLRALGRRANAASGPRALALLWERGVFTVVNALLIGPTIPFGSILNEIEGLSRIDHAPVHLLPIEVRAGTSYFRAAAQRGLVEGGFLHWHYRFVDERTELMGEMLTSFPTRLAERSVPIALYDLGYNLGIARRLLPEVNVDRHVATFARVAAAWNRDQIRVLRAAAEVAKGRDRTLARAFVRGEMDRVSAADRALRDACDTAMRDVEACVSRFRRRPVQAHARGQLLGAVAFSMSIAACGGLRDDLPGSSTPTATDASATPDASGHSGASSDSNASADDVVNAAGVDGSDGASDGLSSGDSAPTDSSGATTSDGATVVCTDRDAAASPSGSGYMLPTDAICLSCSDPSALVVFDAQGRAVDFSLGGGGALSPEIRSCLKALFAAYCYPSLAGTTQWFVPHCWIA